MSTLHGSALDRRADAGNHGCGTCPLQPAAHQAEHPQAWADLTPFQQRCVLHAMSRYGGGFVARLAEAWQCADEANSAILGAAFAHRLGSYWPGTVLHAEAALRELA